MSICSIDNAAAIDGADGRSTTLDDFTTGLNDGTDGGCFAEDDFVLETGFFDDEWHKVTGNGLTKCASRRRFFCQYEIRVSAWHLLTEQK